MEAPLATDTVVRNGGKKFMVASHGNGRGEMTPLVGAQTYVGAPRPLLFSGVGFVR